MKSNQVRRCNINQFIQLYLPFQYFRIKTYVRTCSVLKILNLSLGSGRSYVALSILVSFYTFYCHFFFFFINRKKKNCRKGGKKEIE